MYLWGDMGNLSKGDSEMLQEPDKAYQVKQNWFPESSGGQTTLFSRD